MHGARVLFSVGSKKVFYIDSFAAYKGISGEEGVSFLILKGFGVAGELFKVNELESYLMLMKDGVLKKTLKAKQL